MNRPYDVAVYYRSYGFGVVGCPYSGRNAKQVDAAITGMLEGSDVPSEKVACITFKLHNGQRVIVRPLSPMRRQMREDDRKAHDRFIPTMNLDGTTNYETATRLAQAFVSGEPQRMKPTRGTGTMSAEAAMALNLRAREVLKTACDHLGPRGYGE